jgi:hypothetical protein
MNTFIRTVTPCYRVEALRTFRRNYSLYHYIKRLNWACKKWCRRIEKSSQVTVGVLLQDAVSKWTVQRRMVHWFVNDWLEIIFKEYYRGLIRILPQNLPKKLNKTTGIIRRSGVPAKNQTKYPHSTILERYIYSSLLRSEQRKSANHQESINQSIYLSIYLSMALQSFCWALAAFSVS